MRNIYIIFMLLTLTITGLFAKDLDTTIRLKSMNNNIISSQQIYAVDTNTTTTEYFDNSGNKFNSKSDIIVKFTNSNEVNIQDIESKYGLRFKRKMTIGDFIFENTGTINTLEIINFMIEDNELNIKRIMPNLVFSMYKL